MERIDLLTDSGSEGTLQPTTYPATYHTILSTFSHCSVSEALMIGIRQEKKEGLSPSLPWLHIVLRDSRAPRCWSWQLPEGNMWKSSSWDGFSLGALSPCLLVVLGEAHALSWSLSSWRLRWQLAAWCRPTEIMTLPCPNTGQWPAACLKALPCGTTLGCASLARRNTSLWVCFPFSFHLYEPRALLGQTGGLSGCTAVQHTSSFAAGYQLLEAGELPGSFWLEDSVQFGLSPPHNAAVRICFPLPQCCHQLPAQDGRAVYAPCR